MSNPDDPSAPGRTVVEDEGVVIAGDVSGDGYVDGMRLRISGPAAGACGGATFTATCSYFWMYCDGGTWQVLYTPC